MRIIEVGPRDGLQNEAANIPIESKLDFIQHLADAGLTEIEATSFVSPKWVPQLADAEELWPQLSGLGSRFSALVPNMKGLERAVALGVDRIALFTAASNAFTVKNINMTVDQSIEVFKEVADTFRQARQQGWIRGYVSTAFECPYAGRIDPRDTVNVATRLLELGVDEVSIGDTIGVAAPGEVAYLTGYLQEFVPLNRVAFHFHDTRGTAVANVSKALEMGVRAFDSCAGGLGGCPYAPGAGGNLATEDLVYLLERSGLSTGVDLAKLAQASLPVLGLLGRAPVAKAQLATLAASSPK